MPTVQEAGANTPHGYYWRAGLRAPHFDIPQVLPTLTEKAVEILHERAQHKEQPFFLYFAMPSPHTPWVPLAEYKGKSGAGLYGDYVAEVDAMIGRVLDTVHDAGHGSEHARGGDQRQRRLVERPRTLRPIRIALMRDGAARRPTFGRPGTAFRSLRGGRDTFPRTRSAMRRRL